MKIHSSPKRAPDRQQDAKQQSLTTHAQPAQHPATALRAVRIHVTPAGDRRAQSTPESVAPPELQEVQQALAAYEAARNQGTYPAFDFCANSPTCTAFIKERDQGGVDLWMFNTSKTHQGGKPCIEHLYWPNASAFQEKLYLASQSHPDCPSTFAGHPPSREAMLKFLGALQQPVETSASWLRRHMAPRSIAFTPAPANTRPEPTQEQALKALDAFKREGHHPAYEVSAGQPRREGWIKRGDAGGVALMAINNSYARQAHEPRMQVLYWPDENAFAAQLYGSLREGKNCPHPKPGQAPDIDAMLKHLQQCHTPLETFLVWCCVLTAPRTVDIRPAAAQPASSAHISRPPVLAPDEQWRRVQQRLGPVRLVDRVNTPLAYAVASPDLRRNIVGRREDWVVLDGGQARARLDLQQMRICMDLGPHRDALSIWLSPDRTRVIDITGHPLADTWGSAQCPPPGLLRDNFVQAAQPARALLINGSTSQLSRLPTVTPFDVDALGDTADRAQGLARRPIQWDASEADMQLPRSLDS